MNSASKQAMMRSPGVVLSCSGFCADLAMWQFTAILRFSTEAPRHIARTPLGEIQLLRGYTYQGLGFRL